MSTLYTCSSTLAVLLLTASPTRHVAIGTPPPEPGVTQIAHVVQAPTPDASQEEALYYDGEDRDELSREVIEALIRVGARIAGEGDHGIVFFHFDDSYLKVKCWARDMDHLFVSALIELAPAACANDRRLIDAVTAMNCDWSVGQVALNELDDGVVVLSISRHLAFQDHLTDAFLQAWLIDFEGACDWLMERERETLEMWMPKRPPDGADGEEVPPLAEPADEPDAAPDQDNGMVPTRFQADLGSARIGFGSRVPFWRSGRGRA